MQSRGVWLRLPTKPQGIDIESAGILWSGRLVIKKTSFFSWLLLLVLCLMLTGCDKAYESQLKIGANHWVGYFPLYIAESEGFLSKSNTQLLEYPSSVDVIRALKNRVIHAAALTLDEAISLADTGYPVRIILVADISNGADVIVARQGLKTVADLKGQRIGVEHTAVGGFMLSRALSLNGVLATELSVVSVAVENHIDALKSGQIDAVVTFASELGRLDGFPVEKIFDSSNIPNEIVDVLVVDAAWQDDQQLAALVQSWFKSWQLWKSKGINPQALAEQLGLSEVELQNMLDTLIMGDKTINQSLLVDNASDLHAIMQNLQNLMLDAQFLSSKLNVQAAQLIDPTIYQKARP